MKTRKLKNSGEDKRTQERLDVPPYDLGTFVEFNLGDEKFRLNLLDTSLGGLGMLVMEGEANILKKFYPGQEVTGKLCTPEADIQMRLEVRYITPMMRGPFKGHYRVGFSSRK